MKTYTSVIAFNIILSTVSVINAFIPPTKNVSILNPQKISSSSLHAVTKKTKAIDEALQIYQKRFPKKGSIKKPFWQSWGVPAKDLDGTTYKVSPTSTPSKSVFDIDEKQQRTTFQEISRLYGEPNALEMTKALPAILAFDKKNFAPSLKAYGQIFGDDEAKAMVMRNPGLLAVKPTGYGGADQANDQTMQFSYIVGATRPLGPVLLYGLLGLLSVPVIEGISGVPFRANLIEQILSSS